MIEKSVHAPVSVVFRALAAEADALGELGARLEQTLCGAPCATDADVRAFQDFDRLLQNIAALHDLCVLLSEAPGAAAKLNVTAALGAVKLDEIVNRLAHMMPGERCIKPVAAAGDIDLW